MSLRFQTRPTFTRYFFNSAVDLLPQALCFYCGMSLMMETPESLAAWFAARIVAFAAILIACVTLHGKAVSSARAESLTEEPR